MSNRRSKREKHDLRNRGRLRYLIAVLDLEDLKRIGVVPDEFVEKPNATTIERMLDERLKTFQKSDTRLRARQRVQAWDRRLAAGVFERVDKLASDVQAKNFTADELHDIYPESR